MVKRRKIKKILLVNPPNIVWSGKEQKRVDFPIGLGYLSAVLKMEGFEVEGMDVLMEGFDTEEILPDGKVRFGLTDDEIKKRVEDFKPDVVGVSSMFSKSFNLAFHMCKLAKAVDPNIIVLLGGHHPSSIPADCLKRAGGSVDFVLIGEAEFSTGQLLRAISKGDDLSRIPGVAFLDEKGNPVINPYVEPLYNLDVLPWPDRSLFSIYKYSKIGQPHGDDLKERPYTTFITSRGCPFHCIFCAAFHVHGRTFRPRHPDLVLDELEYLVNHMGVREIHFEDDNLTFDRDRAVKIFQGILDRKLELSWIPSSGVAFYTLDREVLTLMRDSGCHTIWVPVESGDPETLKRIKKPTKMEKFRELVPVIKELGMQAKGLFIYGFPFETREQMERTFQFAKELDLDYATFPIATPLPGTELWDMAIKVEPKLGDPDFDWERLQFGVSNLQIAGMSTDEMNQLRRKVWLDVNWGLDEKDEPPAGK